MTKRLRCLAGHDWQAVLWDQRWEDQGSTSDFLHAIDEHRQECRRCGKDAPLSLRVAVRTLDHAIEEERRP